VTSKVELEDGDVVVLAQKAVSKAEGRVVRLEDIDPSDEAREIAGDDQDPRRIEAILREAKRVVRVRKPLVIAETRHGFICASAGVDSSNAPELGMLVLLPIDPDASARGVRDRIRELTGRDVGVLVTDSFGRPWRQGTIDVALGAAGIEVMRDLRGHRDRVGYELHATMIAVGDEIASAAELVMGKVDGIPAAIVRGLDVAGDGRATDLVIPEERDLFR
jgi:coenzyme F420-0:L-glutamate ligase/coenzyme F420-1:gamma-L-glutamate ligase